MINEAELSRQFCEKHPAEAASVLARLAPETAAAFLSGLPPADSAMLLQYMLPRHAAPILARLAPEPLVAVLSHLNLTEAVGMLRPLDAEQREALFVMLPRPLHMRLTRLIGFPADTVGSLLATPPLILPEEWSVKFSVREFRRIPPTPVTDLPVVDQQQRLLGTVSLHRLLSQRDDLRVGTLADASLPALPAEAPLESVAHHPFWDRSTAVPVVDPDQKLLGVLHRASLREYLAGRQGPPGLKGVTPVMALAEAYWTSFSALIAMVSERFPPPRKK